MIVSKNLYRNTIIIFIYQILYFCFTPILNKHLYNIDFTIVKNVFTQLISFFYLKTISCLSSFIL